jgi:signal peptidase I
LIALKKFWKNNYFKTVVAIALIVGIVLGFFFGMQLGLKTSYPLLTVESGSMCIPYDGLEDQSWQGFSLSVMHPFDRTLSVGDIIILQGVNPKDLNINYPNSDIIVYHDPRDPTNPKDLIVHRIVAREEINGTLYFYTKGDGNSNGNSNTKWPNVPDRTLYDPWSPVPQNLVIGKVIMRIPWFGWITLLMRENTLALPIIIAIIMVLIILEFVIPIIRGSNKKNKEQSEASTSRNTRRENKLSVSKNGTPLTPMA